MAIMKTNRRLSFAALFCLLFVFATPAPAQIVAALEIPAQADEPHPPAITLGSGVFTLLETPGGEGRSLMNALMAQASTSGNATTLGVSVDRISDDLRAQLPDVKPGAGLVIRYVSAGGPAAAAGLLKDDILLAWDNDRLVHPDQLGVLVQSSKPGEQVNLTFLRKSAQKEVKVTLAKTTDTQPAAANAAPHTLPSIKWHADQSFVLGSNGALTLADGGKLAEEMRKELKTIGLDDKTIDDAVKALAGGLKGPTTVMTAKITVVGPDGKVREISSDRDMEIYQLLNRFLGGDKQPAAGNPGK